MPPKGYRKPFCVNGHPRTPENTTALEHGSACKVCTRERLKAGRPARTEAQKAKHAAHNRQWAANNPDKVLNTRLKKAYGITLGEYNQLVVSQDGCCAVCKVTFTDRAVFGADRPVVDHCHVSNKVRGILCSNCNVGIGLLKEDRNVLANAIEYLKAA
jgi:hypothetical protein